MSKNFFLDTFIEKVWIIKDLHLFFATYLALFNF